jgi:hypothetical protein
MDLQQEGLPAGITLRVDRNGLLYIPTVRAMFISVLSKAATGSKDKTEPGRP